MALNDPLKSGLARLPLASKLRLLFWLAENEPAALRRALDEQEPKCDVIVVDWQINGAAPEGAAAEPDPPAALG